MDNFWGLILKGIGGILTWFIYGNFPPHHAVGMVDTVQSMVSTTLGLVFVIVFSNINMILPIATATMIFLLEPVHYIYAAWRWLKRIFI